MSQFVETPTKSFAPGAAIAQFLRVKLSAGKLAAAGAADIELGTMEDPSYGDVSPAVVAVRLRTAPGTVKMVAAGAVAAGAKVYGAASGKIDDTANTNFIGIALEAATADNDVIEVLRTEAQNLKIVCGEVTLDGTNPTSVTTGLAAIVAAYAGQKSATTPGDDPSAFTVDYGGSVTAGQLDIYAWKNTSGTDPTLVASTNNAAVVSYIAIGTV